MYWYVIHTKPRQETRALTHLERQGYECFLPMFSAQKIVDGKLTVVEESLFPRYLFIHLDAGAVGQSWAPIRSTRGVSRLVTFGSQPARVSDELIGFLRARSDRELEAPKALFSSGEKVVITEGPFAGVDAVFQMSDGERRAFVLIELLGKSAKMSVSTAGVRSLDSQG